MPSQEAVPESGEYTLVILHNNDGESKLLEDQDSGFPGAARFAALMKQLQSQAGGAVITLTSGDNFLASQELGVSLARENAPLYDSVALSGLYDAMALGNHDFDLGTGGKPPGSSKASRRRFRSSPPTSISRVSLPSTNWWPTACSPPAW